jgi:hypothetical protein
MRQVDERHVQAMETVVGLWCYPTMADRALLVEVLDLVRAAAGGMQAAPAAERATVLAGGFDDWRVEYVALGEPYESDQ